MYYKAISFKLNDATEVNENIITLSTRKSMESQISLSLKPLSKFPITIFLRTKAGIIQNLVKNFKKWKEYGHFEFTSSINIHLFKYRFFFSIFVHVSCISKCPRSLSLSLLRWSWICLIENGCVIKGIAQNKGDNSWRPMCILCKFLGKKSP